MPSSRVRATKAREVLHRARAAGGRRRARPRRCRSPTASRRRRRSGRQGVVRALAVDLADRVDRRQVDDVEAHARRSPAAGRWRVGERAVRSATAADDRALRAREELVPGAVERPSAGRPRPRSRGDRVTSSRTGCSCRYACSDAANAGAMRAVSSSEVSRSAAAAASERRRGARRSASAATRSSSRAPSSRSLARSSAPWPASTFTSTAWCQVASGSLHASTRRSSGPRGRGRRSRASGRAPGRASPSG